MPGPVTQAGRGVEDLLSQLLGTTVRGDERDASDEDVTNQSVVTGRGGQTAPLAADVNRLSAASPSSPSLDVEQLLNAGTVGQGGAREVLPVQSQQLGNEQFPRPGIKPSQPFDAASATGLPPDLMQQIQDVLRLYMTGQPTQAQSVDPLKKFAQGSL